MARAARGADEERRLDRAVGQAPHAVVAIGLVGGERLAETLPAAGPPVQLHPPLAVEPGIGELAVAEGAGGGPERQIAGGLPLVLLGVVRMVRLRRGIAEITRRVAIAGPAHELEQLLVARTPVEAVGLVRALRGTAVRARRAAARIVDEPIGSKAIVALVGAQHAEPVDENPGALLEDVGVKARVAAGCLVPDLASGDFRRGEACFAFVEARIVLRGRRARRLRRRRLRCCWRRRRLRYQERSGITRYGHCCNRKRDCCGNDGNSLHDASSSGYGRSMPLSSRSIIARAADAKRPGRTGRVAPRRRETVIESLTTRPAAHSRAQHDALTPTPRAMIPQNRLRVFRTLVLEECARKWTGRGPARSRPVIQHGERREPARRAHHAAARMRAGAALVERVRSASRSAPTPGPGAGRTSAAGVELALEDVALGEAHGALDVRGRDDLPVEDRRAAGSARTRRAYRSPRRRTPRAARRSSRRSGGRARTARRST